MALITLGTLLVASPFCVGMIRLSRRLGVLLAERALPAARGGKVDLAAAPRRALVVTLQLATVLLGVVVAHRGSL